MCSLPLGNENETLSALQCNIISASLRFVRFIRSLRLCMCFCTRCSLAWDAMARRLSAYKQTNECKKKKNAKHAAAKQDRMYGMALLTLIAAIGIDGACNLTQICTLTIFMFISLSLGCCAVLVSSICLCVCRVSVHLLLFFLLLSCCALLCF